MKTTTLSQDQSLQRIARVAYHAQSFRPEDRGQRMLDAYSQELQQDIAEIEEMGADSESVLRYSDKYKQFVFSYFSKESNVMSAMITGPARFPTHRNQKRQRSVENHINVFNEWRTRAKRAIKRHLSPTVTISGELQANIDKLEKLQKHHEQMKTFNAMMRKKQSPEVIAEKTGISIENVNKLMQPDFCGRLGFPQYKLTNNLATIKNTQDRIKVLSNKVEAQETGAKREYITDLCKIVVSGEADRIQLYFDGKPSDQIRTELKSLAFKWSPNNGCWQRKITPNALWSTKRYFNLDKI